VDYSRQLQVAFARPGFSKALKPAELPAAQPTKLALRDDDVALVARRRVPAIYSDTFFVKLGGLA
jgi:hypothetical protein